MTAKDKRTIIIAVIAILVSLAGFAIVSIKNNDYEKNESKKIAYHDPGLDSLWQAKHLQIQKTNLEILLFTSKARHR